MSRRGVCHCGRVVFELRAAAAEPDPPAGAGAAGSPTGRTPLLSVPRERLRLLSSEDGVGAYTFGERIIGHRFCRTCGTHLYGEDIDAQGPGFAYINADCLARG